MLKGPACGLPLRCSFHKCLLYFINRISNRHQSWFSSHVDEALFTRAQICKWMMFQHSVQLSPWQPVASPHPLHIYSPQGLTEIHWFGSVHLFVLFIDFHYVAFCLSPSTSISECFISFASRRIQTELDAYLLVLINHSRRCTFFFHSFYRWSTCG